MNKTAVVGAIFGGMDFRNAGGGRNALPGTSWLDRNPVPKPTQPPVSMLGNLDPRTPQGFATMAGMFKPITEAIGGAGGMPAMMGIYGMMTGNKDWQTATTAQPRSPAADSRLMKMPPAKNYQAPMPQLPATPNVKTARLPLPVMTPNGLAMGKIAASNWASAPKAAPTWFSDKPTAPPIDKTPAWFPKSEQQPVQQAPAPRPSIAQIGKALAGGAAAYQGSKTVADLAAKKTLGQSLRQGGTGAAEKLIAKGAPRIVSKAVPMVGVDTLVNAGTDLADLAGIYSIDQSKEFNAWQKPRLDANGEVVRNQQTGEGQWDFGFNPKGFGWNMDEYNKRTTPDGTIAFGLKTGKEPVDAVGSYGTSAINAYWNPLKSIYSLSNFGAESNPLMSKDHDSEWKGWSDIAKGQAKPVIGGSIPLIMANRLAQNPEAPSLRRGSLPFNIEVEKYRLANKYHPVYNPDGKIGR